MSKNSGEIIKQKVLEQLEHIKAFSRVIGEKTATLKIENEIIKGIKKSNPNITIEDVRENLINLMVSSGEIHLMNEQVVKYHLTLFNEYKTLADILKIPLDFSKQDEDFINSLADVTYLLYAVENGEVVPLDKEVYSKIMDNHKKRSEEQQNLQVCLDNVKI